jgi:hypothetical protein
MHTRPHGRLPEAYALDRPPGEGCRGGEVLGYKRLPHLVHLRHEVTSPEKLPAQIPRAGVASLETVGPAKATVYAFFRLGSLRVESDPACESMRGHAGSISVPTRRGGDVAGRWLRA